jgi:hypothetical protein
VCKKGRKNKEYQKDHLRLHIYKIQGNRFSRNIDAKRLTEKQETRKRNKKEQSRYKYMLPKVIIYFYAVRIDRQKHWNGLYQVEGSAFDAGLIFDAGLDFDAGFPLTDAGFAFEEGFALAAVPLVAVLDLGLDTGFFTSPVTAYTVLLSRHAT